MLRRPVEFTQYVSIRYTERLADAGIEPSVGSVGNSYDNALAETVIGLFKTEVIRRCGPWRNVDAVEFATLEWVDWFNNRRLLEPIGNIPPAEAEARYYEQLNDLAMAARPKQNSLRQTRRGSVAFVSDATTAHQRVVLASLRTTGVVASGLPRHAPTLIVIGPVLALREVLTPLQQAAPMTAAIMPEPSLATA